MRFRCPVPDCDHLFDMLTQLHCQNAHGMKRDQVLKKYGQPIKLGFSGEKRRQNMKAHVGLSRMDFTTHARKHINDRMR